MQRKRGRKGWLALKLDLEKAYDRISWPFLEVILCQVSFHASLNPLLGFCVSSASLSVLWNGEQLENFKPSRGLIQGDPLSPYLFVLSMEALSFKYVILETAKSI